MWNRLFIRQELIDVPAVSMEQILTIPDSYCHRIQLISIKWKEETGKADEITWSYRKRLTAETGTMS